MAEIDEALIDRLVERLERISKERTNEVRDDLEDVTRDLKSIARDISVMARAAVGEKDYSGLLKKAFEENRRQEDRTANRKRRVAGSSGGRGGLDPEAKRLEDSLRKSSRTTSSTLSMFVERVGALDGSFAKLGAMVGLNYTAFRLLTTYLDGTIQSWRAVTEVGTGFSEGMVEMRLAAAHSRLDLEAFAKAIVNSSRAINALSIKDFGMLRRQVGDNLREFGMLGMTTEQITSTLGDYLEIQRISGTLKRGQDVEQAAGYQRLMLGLTKLSEAAGIARETLLKSYKEATERYDINSWLSGATEKQKEAWEEASAIIGILPAGMKDMLGAGISMGQVIMSEAAREMMKVAPGVVTTMQELSDGIRNGSLTQREALLLGDKLKRQFTELTPRQLQSINLMASQGVQGAQAFLGAIKDFQSFNSARAKEEVDRKRALEPFTKAMSNMQQSVSKITGALSKLVALVLEKIAPMFTWLAEKMEVFAEDVISFTKAISEGKLELGSLWGIISKLGIAFTALLIPGFIAGFLLKVMIRIADKVLRLVGMGRGASLLGGAGITGRAAAAGAGRAMVAGDIGMAAAGGAAATAVAAGKTNKISKFARLRKLKGLRAATPIGLAGMITGGLVRGFGTSITGATEKEQRDAALGKTVSISDTVGAVIEGAATGAAIGTMIFPGAGTAIGAGLGSIAGAILENLTYLRGKDDDPSKAFIKEKAIGGGGLTGLRTMNAARSEKDQLNTSNKLLAITEKILLLTEEQTELKREGNKDTRKMARRVAEDIFIGGAMGA